jgi:hypothetical protein
MPWDLQEVYECYQWFRDRANFPPIHHHPNGSIASWYNHLACVPVPNAQVGDRLRVTGQVLAMSYHAPISAFEPVFCSVHTSDKVNYEPGSEAQRAAYKWTGIILLPASGENINNVNGGYYRPHRRSTDIWWHTVVKVPVYVHLWMPLSSFSADNATYLETPSMPGGQGAFVVEHYRRR